MLGRGKQKYARHRPSAPILLAGQWLGLDRVGQNLSLLMQRSTFRVSD